MYWLQPVTLTVRLVTALPSPTARITGKDMGADTKDRPGDNDEIHGSHTPNMKLAFRLAAEGSDNKAVVLNLPSASAF